MSRRTEKKPIPLKPVVLLGQHALWGGRGHKAKTLIGRASRVLYLARRDEDAERLRDMLLAADQDEYVTILSAFVSFFPAASVSRHPIGDVGRHWSSSLIRPEQRRREEAGSLSSLLGQEVGG